MSASGLAFAISRVSTTPPRPGPDLRMAAPAALLRADILVPEPRIRPDERGHQVDACSILEHVDHDTARPEQRFVSHERLTLPDDDMANAVEQDGTAAHRTR